MTTVHVTLKVSAGASGTVSLDDDLPLPIPATGGSCDVDLEPGDHKVTVYVKGKKGDSATATVSIGAIEVVSVSATVVGNIPDAYSEYIHFTVPAVRSAGASI